jgi:hypothetical protein
MAGVRFEAMIRQRWGFGEVNARLENMMQTENDLLSTPIANSETHL